MIIDMTVSAMEQKLDKKKSLKGLGDDDHPQYVLNFDHGDQYSVWISDCNIAGGSGLNFGSDLTISSNGGGNIVFDAPVTFKSGVVFSDSVKFGDLCDIQWSETPINWTVGTFKFD